MLIIPSALIIVMKALLDITLSAALLTLINFVREKTASEAIILVTLTSSGLQRAFIQFKDSPH